MRPNLREALRNWSVYAAQALRDLIDELQDRKPEPLPVRVRRRD
jgi:hypothetical protein